MMSCAVRSDERALLRVAVALLWLTSCWICYSSCVLNRTASECVPFHSIFLFSNVWHILAPCQPWKCDERSWEHRMCSLHGLILMVPRRTSVWPTPTAIGGRFQERKAAANAPDYTSVRTEGVVDDLKQGEIARCHAVHPQLHHHCLRKRTKQREEGSKIARRVSNVSGRTWTADEVTW